MEKEIDDEWINRLSVLAKLELSEKERAQVKGDLERMLAYVNVLNKVNTEGVEPMTHIFPPDNVFREDEVCPSAGREKVLANAPKQQEGMFVVPSTIEPPGGN